MELLKGKVAIGASIFSIILITIMVLWVYISLFSGKGDDESSVTPISEHALAACLSLILPSIIYSTVERIWGVERAWGNESQSFTSDTYYGNGNLPNLEVDSPHRHHHIKSQ